MTDITSRQREVFNAIVGFRDEHGYSPSIRDLALHLGVSVHAADCHVRVLAKKGVISRAPNVARGITIPQA